MLENSTDELTCHSAGCPALGEAAVAERTKGLSILFYFSLICHLASAALEKQAVDCSVHLLCLQIKSSLKLAVFAALYVLKPQYTFYLPFWQKLIRPKVKHT